MESFVQIKAQVDKTCEPLLKELVILLAVKKVASQRGLTLKEQLHIWRPFDV